MSTLGRKIKNKKEMETSLFEKTFFSVFDQYDREKQTDLINELIRRSKNTYFENSTREVLMRGLTDVRLQANKRKLPTSIEYLREIECRILHLVFKSSHVGKIWEGNRYMYVLGSQEIAEEHFNRVALGNNVLPLNCNIIKNFRNMYLAMDIVMIVYVDPDKDPSSTTVTSLSSYVFGKEEVFNERLESLGFPKFFFNPIYLQQEWIIFNIIYGGGHIDKYHTFLENWHWVKENAKCMVVPEPKIVCDIFFNAQFININKLNAYNEDPTKSWSIYEGLGEADLRTLNATLRLSLTEHKRIPLAPLLIMDRQDMFQHLTPVM